MAVVVVIVLGIKFRNKTQNCHADSAGIELNFRVMSEAAATFREGAAMPEGWNDEIQKDYKKRGGRK